MHGYCNFGMCKKKMVVFSLGNQQFHHHFMPFRLLQFIIDSLVDTFESNR